MENKQRPKPSIPKWSNWVGEPVKKTPLTEDDVSRHFARMPFGTLDDANKNVEIRFRKTFGGK